MLNVCTLPKMNSSGPVPGKEHMTVSRNEKKTTSKNKVKVVEIPEAAGTYDLCIIWNLARCRGGLLRLLLFHFVVCKNASDLRRTHSDLI